MDRPRRFLLAIVVLPVVAAVLSGAVWFGYRMGEGLRAGPPSSRSAAWSSTQATPDETPPGLLPECEVIRRANRLQPIGESANFLPYRNMPRDDVASFELPSHSTQSLDGPVISREELPPEADSTPEVAQAVADAHPKKPAADVEPSASGLAFDGPSATPWATPYRPGARSLQLEQAARQADYHTRRGFDLASRKAYHSARAEFVQALRVVAQGLDSERGTQVHGRALSSGLTALDEADDFVPVGSKLEGDLDLGGMITGHETTVLKLADHRRLTPLQCVRHYVEYAREQLAVAAGGEVAGSMALHALGKLHWSLAERQHASRPIDDTKALVLLQAASEACRENYLALNDLGVLLARGGRYADARDALEQSVAIGQDPTVQMNLAAIYRRLGDTPRAQQIEQQTAALLAAHGKSAHGKARPAPPVTWVAPQKFAGSYASVAGPWQPAPVKRDSQPQTKEPAAERPPVQQASRGFSWDWFIKAKK